MSLNHLLLDDQVSRFLNPTFNSMKVIHNAEIDGDLTIMGNVIANGEFILDGVTGIFGPTGPAGVTGPTGAMGPLGPTGALLASQYYESGAMPATIAAAQPFTFESVAFDNIGIVATTGITGPFSASGTIFNVSKAGVYNVSFQATIVENGSMNIYYGATIGAMAPIVWSGVGRATGTSQIMNSVLINAAANSFFSINAMAGNSVALTVPSNASTTNQAQSTVSFILL